MNVDSIFRGMHPSASALRAERTRMEVVAGNIANAETTRGPDGKPYRRRVVQFAPVLDRERGLAGVEVQEVREDPSELPRVYRPGHPDADPEGFVLLPNVNLPMEMVDLATAARVYEANLAALRAFKEISEQALGLGGR
ncbi:MAG: flagellar basal body rod protein FlgC [Planctomycetota bacterium]|nr:MAG: flagellar basal body rod protein FlgC [Planctomycetota bacterium]